MEISKKHAPEGRIIQLIAIATHPEALIFMSWLVCG